MPTDSGSGLSGRTSRRGALKIAAAGGLSLIAAAVPAVTDAKRPHEERNWIVYLPGVEGLEPGDALGISRTDGKVEKLALHLYAAGVHAFLPQRGRAGARLVPVVIAGVTRVKVERQPDGTAPLLGFALDKSRTPGVMTSGGFGLGIVLEQLVGQAGLIRILITGA